MTKTVLIAGTASHVGKSTIAAGLCRLLADRGIVVAPFKAQNMSNNARVVVRPEVESTDANDGGRVGDGSNDDDPDHRWGEIGVSQFVQARAARTTPTTDVNPVLLKPRGDGECQLVVQGRAIEHLTAGAYYDAHWERARDAAEESYCRLAADADVVIAEGAGSIAEINLHDRDLANVETVRFGNADIVLLVDIERGGAFASLYGTIELLPDDLRERVVGAVVTKFRGDPSLLEPGIESIESKTGVPVLGVIPYDDPGLPEEDSVGLPPESERGVRGGDDGVSPDRSVTVGVPRLPRISNATDLEALSDVPGVRVAYLPLTTSPADELAAVDAVVLPGTKNTVDDLLALREAGYDDHLSSFDGPIVGICGGYQLLGEHLRNASREGIGDRETVDGLGLLPVETVFGESKHLEQTTVPVDGCGPIAGATGTATGYEIHVGETTVLGAVDRPLGAGSAARDHVLGTYLHGLFDNSSLREAFVDAVYRHAGIERPVGTDDPADRGGGGGALESPYDRAARLVADHVDLGPLGPPFTDVTR